MAPETRSRGVPPPSRVYHDSPTLQQVQFPSRKKKIRRRIDSERRSLKQQTLTQIDFVSSFDEDEDVVGVSEDDIHDDVQVESGHVSSDNQDDDKENAPPPNVRDSHQVEQTVEEEDDDLFIPRRQRRVKEAPKRRRRTMGDEGSPERKTRRIDEGCQRRRTFGESRPLANYHTQTLTQFLGHQTSFVADSDEEELGGLGADDDNDDEEQNDGFLSWLGEPDPGSPSAGRGRPRLSSPTIGTSVKGAAVMESVSRENSVIPQTPAKNQGTAIRFDMPSGGLASPSERMMDRYGAPGVLDSPLKNRSSPMGPPCQGDILDGDVASRPSVDERKPSLVIQDSYTTDEGWTTPSKSQTHFVRKTPKGTCKTTHIPCTPSKLGTSQGVGTPLRTKMPRQSQTPSRQKMPRAGLHEIPDSDEDEDVHAMDNFEDEEDHAQISDAHYAAGVETQAVMTDIASTHEQDEAAHETDLPLPLSLPLAHSSKQENDDDDNDDDNSNNGPSRTAQSPMPTQVTGEPIRRPLHHPSNYAQPSQPWESQRVPVSELQSLPAPSARSDIILPISTGSLKSLITGHTDAVTTLFRIPSQVVRFWLFENHHLRYMASVEPGEQQQRQGEAPPQASAPCQPLWQFHALQVYELNNPVQEQDMLEEGWIKGSITRYAYLPPAVVGQLLWNLRHALFGGGSEGADSSSAPSPDVQHVALPHKDNQPDMDRTPRRIAFSPRSSSSSSLSLSPPPGSMSVSQQVAAQIHSDMACSTSPPLPASDDAVPSTPGSDETPRVDVCSKQQEEEEEEQAENQQPHPQSPSPARQIYTQHTTHPSQATTLSQASTPEKPQSQSQDHILKTRVRPPFPPPLFSASDNSIRFLDHSGPLSSLPIPSSMSSTSQLLTKSQLLPDSLIRDHAPPLSSLPEPEICDSDDEDVSL